MNVYMPQCSQKYPDDALIIMDKYSDKIYSNCLVSDAMQMKFE